jgi:hypothetical protein
MGRRQRRRIGGCSAEPDRASRRATECAAQPRDNRAAACASIVHALWAYEALDLREYEPFRLVMVQRAAVAVADAAHPATKIIPLTLPVMFTSSSLGDAFVEQPRRELFERLVLVADDWLHGRTRFHRHRWTSRPEISVNMAREDAATVSRTTIDVTSSTIDHAYESLPGQLATAPAAA